MFEVVQRRWSALLGLMIAGASMPGCGAPPDEQEFGASDQDADPDVGSSEEEIRNGTVVNPWSGGPLYTRAIVRVGGCTGTVVAPRWVLTYQGCTTSVGAVATSVRPTGNVTRTVDRVHKHPYFELVMLRLSSPMPDMPSIPLFAGETGNLWGEEVVCYGYGAHAAGPACTSDAQCASNWCHSGMCLSSTGQLRSGTMEARSPGNAKKGYFDTTELFDQSPLPGDGGGPCFRNGALAGVNVAWYLDLHGGVNVGVPDVRAFVERNIRPYVRGDVDGDGTTDTTVWRGSNGTWYIWPSASSSSTWLQWGQLGDIPVLGDFNGNGVTDPTVFRPSTGRWHITYLPGGLTTTLPFGQSGDVPVPADYDGDGRTNYAYWRKSNGDWRFHYEDASWGGFNWGMTGDIPVPGDYDGDGRADAAVFRPSTDTWHISQSSTQTGTSIVWGPATGASDRVAPGDYDGDGLADCATLGDGAGGTTWHIRKSSGGTETKTWGQAGDIAVPGDYDGDGKTDAAVFRPSAGLWYILPSGGGGGYWRGWGLQTDIPVPRVIQ